MISVVSVSDATWNGPLGDGTGRVMFTSSGEAVLEFDWRGRSTPGGTTATPEEMLGAALANCYSMALAHALDHDGATGISVVSQARVTFDAGGSIRPIELAVRVYGVNLDQEGFADLAEAVKSACPIGASLAVPVVLSARIAV